MRTAVLLATTMYTTVAFGSDGGTVIEKADTLEQTIYGHVQEGAIVDRIGQLDLTLYGKETSDDVNGNIDRLYKAVEANGASPTLLTTVDLIEWMYTGSVKTGSLIDRVNTLERSIKGRVATGPLDTRVANLYKVVVGDDKKIVLEPVTIPATQVFKVKLDQPLNTKINKVGDTFTFTVAQDITVGNLLAIPEGARGTGTITKLVGARSFGRSGEMDLSFDHITTLDGTTFNAIQGPEAKAQTKTELGAAGASVAGVALLGPLGIVGGFFVKGKSVEYPVGQAFYVQPVTAVETYGAAFGESDKKVTATSSATVTTDATDHAVNADAAKTDTPKAATAVSEKTNAVVTDKGDGTATSDAADAVVATITPVVVIKKTS